MSRRPDDEAPEPAEPVRGRRVISREQLRPRGQTLVALFVIGAVLASAILLQGGLGLAEPEAGTPGVVASGAWYCPHGGGKDWQATIYVANPGDEPVDVRARRLGEEKAPGSTRTSIPAGGSVALTASAPERASATVVEYFGGNVAAGWVARTGEDEVGLAAEPCLAGSGTDWTVGDGTAEAEEDSFVVVMNPFAGDAVFTVTALRESDPPGSLSEWNDVVLRAGRSAAFRLNDVAEGDRVLGATVRTSLGRVAVATLGVSKGRGVRSTIGTAGPAPAELFLPGGGDDGESFLTVADPADRGTVFVGSILGPEGSKLVDQGKEARQPSESVSRIQLETDDPTTIWLRAGRERPGIVATRRTLGTSQDLGATAGVPAPGSAWIVFPSVGEAPHRPALVVSNPGNDEAVVSLTTLPEEGRPVTEQIRVPTGRTIVAPKKVLESDPAAPVLVQASVGEVVVASASYSQGKEGVASYAVSAGAPIDPAWADARP